MKQNSTICHVAVCLFMTISLSEEFSPTSREPLPQIMTGDPPAYLHGIRDAAFQNRVTNVVDEPGNPVRGMDILWSRPARHIYSSVAAWDCSDKLLAIRNAGATKRDGSGAWEWLLLDGSSFQPVVPIQCAFVEFRWWNTRAGKMLLVTSEGLIDYDPVTNRSSSIDSANELFSRFDKLSLNYQGNLSKDDRVIVVTGVHKVSGEVHAVAFSFETGKILIEIPLPFPRIDYATISPKGQFVVVNGEFTRAEPDRTRVFDLSGKPVGPDWGPYGTPSHYDLAVDENGREIAVGVAKTALPGIPAGSVISRNIESGEIRLLLKGGYPSHIGCRNLSLPGWAFVSYPRVDVETYPPFSDELVAVRTDGSGRFRRICRFHQTGANYQAQPQACPNTSGTSAIFATNWGAKENPAVSFVVETGLAKE